MRIMGSLILSWFFIAFDGNGAMLEIGPFKSLGQCDVALQTVAEPKWIFSTNCYEKSGELHESQ